MKTRLARSIAALAVVTLFASTLSAQLEPLPHDSGVAGVGLALRRLATTRSVLFVTAHPDDERSGLLTYLSLGQGYRVGIVTLTRGAGGQNEIGPELGDALSVLRTEELRSVHRMDRVEQYFGRVVDFGYSFSVEETLATWGHEESLRDLVHVFREFRPDVVVTMRPDGAGGGQHHQASARLATEAYRVAADPDRFPEQIAAGLRPWRAAHLLIAPFRLRPGEEARATYVPVGEFDVLLGTSYAEFGARARNNHRCQGMNAPPTAANPPAPMLAVEPSVVRSPLFGDLPDGLPRSATLERLPSWGRVGVRLDDVTEAYRRHDLDAVRDGLLRGAEALRECRRQTVDPELGFLLGQEERDWTRAVAASLGGSVTSFVVSAEHAAGTVDGLVTPGETFAVETHGGTAAVELLVPGGWSVRSARRTSTSDSWLHYVTVAKNASYTQPFWKRPSLRDGRYHTRVPAAMQALPFEPPVVTARLTLRSEPEASANAPQKIAQVSIDRPVLHRWYDPAVGLHRTHTVKVVPPVAVHVEPRAAILPLRASRPRRVVVTLNTYLPPAPDVERKGVVRLDVPEGFRATPAQVDVRLGGENSEQRVEFVVTPPRSLGAGNYVVRASCTLDGMRYDQGFQAVSYHHVERQHVYRDASVVLRAFDVELAPGLEVGYVMGVGDDVPRAIEELGARVTQLGAEALSSGDLSRFDAIVLGVRAYKDRTDLRLHNDRLLAYVRDGGTLLTQYNKYEFNDAAFGPYPCTIHRPHDRVTDENAPVRVLEPDHEVFHRPNRIGPQDWLDWVQERGLYFLGEWDERYTPLLEIRDPFPYNPLPKRGALLIARYGKGVYIYTGLAFFRQLPAGVPGAYRLFANLLSTRGS